MTENEKKAFKERETAAQIKGLVQRYVDSAIDLSRFQKELTILKSEVRDELMVARLLGEECLDRIELGKDPERLFEILEKATTVDVPALKEKMKKVEKEINREKVIRESRLASDLKERGPLTLVANHFVRVPKSPLIRSLTVETVFDVADGRIAASVEAGDLVITGDIPLASRVVDAGGVALNPRGTFYTRENIRDHLARRNLMEELRSIGTVTGGPSALSLIHLQEFATALDRYLTHELSHLHLVQNIGVLGGTRLPEWFKEGLAEMVSGGATNSSVTVSDALKAIGEGSSFIPEEGRTLVVSFLFPHYGTYWHIPGHGRGPGRGRGAALARPPVDDADRCLPLVPEDIPDPPAGLAEAAQPVADHARDRPDRLDGRGPPGGVPRR